MDPSLIACSAMETVLIVAGLGFCFLTRNRRSGAADPSHADGDDLQQEKKVENRPSATATELAAHRDDTEHLPFPGSVSAQPGHEFEVFLSFRGKEIRQTFADCLYRSMIRVGVRTFRDNEELHVGEEIGPNLMSAIKQSKICMPIFTKGYATSKWCLREVAEMVKLMKEDLSGKQVIMPIFFDVTPNDVQHQTGSYAEAFTQHKKKIKTETIKEWRDALKEVGKLKGLELSQAANGNQGEFIDLVVAEVLRKLRQAWVDMSENIVGLDDPADAVMQMLELDLNDIRMVGISGIGGIGKTTLATYIYNRIAGNFQCCSFLGDVRETSRKPGGLLELQSKLVDDILGQQSYRLPSTDEAINVLKTRVRGKKALILIDDVDNINQLNALAADPDWFGSGSRILVTSREKKVLNQLPWSNTYELKQLDEDLALDLLCKYAFRDDSPSPEFDDLSRDIVRATGGLPLALVVIGSYLYASRGKKGVWEDTIEQLKRRPHTEVLEKLRISYDALDAEQKEILLGDGNKVQMHDQLRDLGRYIVEQQRSKELELRSRLWQSKEAIDVLSRQQEKKVENAPSDTTTALAAHRHDTEHLPFPGSVSAQPGHEYEVFLSFRGKEIRQTFADCLYHEMISLGVRTFRDNEELHIGEEIGANLISAIKQSKIFIPIFTKGYATSKWCIREVTEMVKLMKENFSRKQVITPIFFDVTPNDVQHQTGSYAEAFSQHEKEIKPETVKQWRDALKEVGKLKGLELSQAANGNQGVFIELVVAEVLRKLRQAWVEMSDNIVGLDDPTDAVMQMLELDLNDIRMVGISGIGGIGKTTLAKYIYNRIAGNFQCCSFLSDVRETSRRPGGLLELQSKLVDDILGQKTYSFTSIAEAVNVLKSRVRGKKALILIDDVDNINQLSALAAKPNWFGSGSRILITTREKKVLNQFPWSNTYELKPLDEVQALKLLHKYAFRDDSPSARFDDLSRDIVHATGGLPLALVVIGSSLYASRGKKGVWEDTIEQLKRRPHTEVLEKLRISYDALDAEQKEIFLDIACFFIGWDCELVIPMWHDCKFYPRLGIEVLQLKCLISIGDGNELQMHDQLRDLGRYIVQQENRKALELRSRLWQSKDAIGVLREQTGTPKIEGVVIWPKEKGVTFSEKCFQNLSKLRILWLLGDVNLDGDYQHLLPNLRLLRWSMESNHPPNLPLNNLVVLNLSGSRVDEDWIAWNSIKMEKLTVLDLSRCHRLRRIPGFSAFPNLERLVLEDCQLLDSIDPSIELLKNMKFLTLRSCSQLKKLPDQLGYLEALSVLIVDKTDVEEIPISARMKKLEFLSANHCGNLKSIPDSVGSLENLKRLSLEECSSLRILPETIGQLKSLIDLRLQHSGITRLPKTLGNLKELQVMDASGCSSLEGEVPVEIGSLSHLQTFHLRLRRYLHTQTLPKLPSSLISLAIESSCSCGEVKKDILAQLCNLEKLVLREVNIRALPDEIGSFSGLKEVEITRCTKLEFLPTLPSNLQSLKVSHCCSLQKLPSLSNLRKLLELQVSCMSLREIDGLGDLISLQSLIIDGCPVTTLDGVQNMRSLHKFYFVRSM